MKFFFAALCVVSLAGCGSSDQPHCKSSSMTIVMKSRYNESGHWQSKVDFSQGGQRTLTTEPWVIDVQQTSSDCEGDQYDLHTTIFLTAPSAGLKNEVTRTMTNTSYVPRGYEVVEGVGVVKTSTRVLPYADAVVDCKTDGAFIMIVDSEAKENFVNSFTDNPAVFINAANGHDIWGGLEVVGGAWASVQGVPVKDIPFFKWASGRPVNGFCTVFAKHLLAHWDTQSCTSPSTRLSYICERPTQE